MLSFGQPVSLIDFIDGKPPEKMLQPLARALMSGIRDVVPVLPVPVVAAILLEKDGISRTEVDTRFRRLVAGMERNGAHVHMPRSNPAYATEVGLRELLLRKISSIHISDLTPSEVADALVLS